MTKIKKIEFVEETYETVTDISIDKLLPNVIDNFLVTIFENHHTILLPDIITGGQFRAWNNGRGGVFSKDVLNYSLNKPHGQYILIKSKKLNCVARVITEEEELQFKTTKLIDGKIKDRSYMILKNLKNNEKITTTQRYINEKEIEPEENVFISTPKLSAQNDDFEHHAGSISLFDE